MLSRKAERNIQTAFVLGGPLAAWIFIPDEILMPLALGCLALGVGGFFAIKAYLKRLHATEARIESGEDLERIQAIRDRTDLATQAGMAFALVGLAAFLVIVLEHA